jgi:general secretion pathway protein L
MNALSRRRAAPAASPLAIHPVGGGAPQPAGAFVATVPGTEAPLLPLDLPPGVRGVARERVARRQLRDAGCGAGLDMRPARLGPGRETWGRMLVCEAGLRAGWAAEAAGAGRRCRAVLPDYLALPAAPGLWVIEAEAGGMVRARLGPDDGFAAEADLARALLEDAARASAPAAILRRGAPDAALDDWLATLGVPVCDAEASLAAEGIAPPVRFAHGELALDLARDPEALRAALRTGLRRIAAALVLGLGGFGLWVASVQVETDRLRALDRGYRANAEAMLRAGLVPAGPVLDIRAQAGAALDRARADAEAARTQSRPLDVLRAAGEVMAAHAPRVTRASYQPGLGLVIDLEIGDFAALDVLLRDLAAAGTGARVARSVAREESGVEAVLALDTTREAGR